MIQLIFVSKSLPQVIYDIYSKTLIPEAIRYWENSLKVKYPYFPIYLGRYEYERMKIKFKK